METKDIVSDTIKKLVQDFLIRDLFYVLGGLSVLFSLYFLVFGILSDFPTNLWIWILILGVAYTLGYAIQDILSLSFFVTTSTQKNPRRFSKFLFERFVGKPWKEPEYSINCGALEIIYSKASRESLSDLRRIIFLKHVGATMGTSWFLCSFLLVIKRIFFQESLIRINISDIQYFLIVFSLFFFSLALLCLNKIKVSQQRQFVSDLYSAISRQSELIPPTKQKIVFQEMIEVKKE